MRFDLEGGGPGRLSRRSMLLGLTLGATSVRTQGQLVSPDTEPKTESSMLSATEPSATELTCKPTTWQDRHANVLENDLIRLVTLTGGAHIAEFRFREESGLSKINPLWNPLWKGIEPYHYREDVHAAQYSAPPTGQLLSGIAGHNLCLEYFGDHRRRRLSRGCPFTAKPASRFGRTCEPRPRGQRPSWRCRSSCRRRGSALRARSRSTAASPWPISRKKW